MNNIAKDTFRALRYRNYRLFFAGQGLSVTGALMQQMAQGWLVYRITDSPLMLGIVAFAGQIPSIFFTPLAGICSDRYDRRKILLIADVVQMIQAFVMAALIFSGVIQPWHIIILSIVLGSAASFEMTTRHSLVPQMVDKREDVGNAIALNSVMFNSARLIGPALAGGVVAWVGEGMCFLLNGFSFFAVIVALLLMKLDKKVAVVQSKPMADLIEGFKYVYEFIPLRIIILFMALVSLSGSGVVVLLPVFAKDVLHGGPQAYGFLIGSIGLGALLGAFYMASRKSVRGLGKLIMIALIVFGLGLIAASFSRFLPIAMLSLTFTGVGMMMHMSSSNTIIQTVTDDDKRGRVMSFYILAFSGFVPIGNLLAGYMAKIFGVREVLAAGGILTLISGIAFLILLPRLRRYLKPVYIKKQIIPMETDVEIR